MRVSNVTTLSAAKLESLVQRVIPPDLEHQDTTIYFISVAGHVVDAAAFRRGVSRATPAPHVWVKVPCAPIFPQFAHVGPEGGKPKSLGVALRSMDEALLYALAHELAHLARGPSERCAHAYGVRQLRRHRRELTQGVLSG